MKIKNPTNRIECDKYLEERMDEEYQKWTNDLVESGEIQEQTKSDIKQSPVHNGQLTLRTNRIRGAIDALIIDIKAPIFLTVLLDSNDSVLWKGNIPKSTYLPIRITGVEYCQKSSLTFRAGPTPVKIALGGSRLKYKISTQADNDIKITTIYN